MATIGTFRKQDDGSVSGAIKTLTLNVKAVVLRPSETDNDKAPDFRIFSGDVGKVSCRRCARLLAGLNSTEWPCWERPLTGDAR